MISIGITVVGVAAPRAGSVAAATAKARSTVPSRVREESASRAAQARRHRAGVRPQGAPVRWLSDDEAVAAAVMLPMVAADRLAPKRLKPHRRRLQAQCAGCRLSEAGARVSPRRVRLIAISA